MMIWIFKSSYFGAFEAWSSPEKWRAYYSESSGVSFRQDGDGWAMYVESRHAPIGRLYRVTCRA